MKVTSKELNKFKRIINTYQNKTDFSPRNSWKKMDNNKLWLQLVGQVNVVGGVNGNDRFLSRPDLKKKLNFNSLSKLNDKKLQRTINLVLREAGVRYASKSLTKCKKSKALVHNYRFVSSFKGGFKGLLNELSTYRGSSSELDRVYFLMDNFKFIKNKSARDFLMGLGMNKYTLAIDIRIQNIFEQFGLKLPDTVELNKRRVYNDIEEEIIKKICIPLKITPVKFDRILFQHYAKIKAK